jgi:hypothetical protein
MASSLNTKFIRIFRNDIRETSIKLVQLDFLLLALWFIEQGMSGNMMRSVLRFD